MISCSNSEAPKSLPTAPRFGTANNRQYDIAIHTDSLEMDMASPKVPMEINAVPSASISVFASLYVIPDMCPNLILHVKSNVVAVQFNAGFHHLLQVDNRSDSLYMTYLSLLFLTSSTAQSIFHFFS